MKSINIWSCFEFVWDSSFMKKHRTSALALFAPLSTVQVYVFTMFVNKLHSTYMNQEILPEFNVLIFQPFSLESLSSSSYNTSSVDLYTFPIIFRNLSLWLWFLCSHFLAEFAFNASIKLFKRAQRNKRSFYSICSNLFLQKRCKGLHFVSRDIQYSFCGSLELKY